MSKALEFEDLWNSDDGQYMANYALNTVIDCLNNNDDEDAKRIILAWIFYGLDSLEDDAVNNGPDS